MLCVVTLINFSSFVVVACWHFSFCVFDVCSRRQSRCERRRTFCSSLFLFWFVLVCCLISVLVSTCLYVCYWFSCFCVFVVLFVIQAHTATVQKLTAECTELKQQVQYICFCNISFGCVCFFPFRTLSVWYVKHLAFKKLIVYVLLLRVVYFCSLFSLMYSVGKIRKLKKSGRRQIEPAHGLITGTSKLFSPAHFPFVLFYFVVAATIALCNSIVVLRRFFFFCFSRSVPFVCLLVRTSNHISSGLSSFLSHTRSASYRCK